MVRKGRHMTETPFTKKFVKYLEACGAVGLTFVGGDQHGKVRQQAGLPDRYVAHWKFRGWLEFKVGSRRLSTAQHVVAGRLDERRDCVMVVRYRPHQDRYEIERFDGTLLATRYMVEVESAGDARQRGLKILESLVEAYDALVEVRLRTGKSVSLADAIDSARRETDSKS